MWSHAYVLLLLCYCAAAATRDSVKQASRPHIVLLAIDDVGWADVGYHGSDFPTPNIDALAKSGVELDRMYAMPQCSPTRSAILTGYARAPQIHFPNRTCPLSLTGRYSFRTGMQHYSTIVPGSTAGIPFDTPTLAELLAAANYSTHMVCTFHPAPSHNHHLSETIVRAGGEVASRIFVLGPDSDAPWLQLLCGVSSGADGLL